MLFSHGIIYKDHPGQIIQIWEGGIAIHGALIGAFITLIYTRNAREFLFGKWSILLRQVC